ncbi:MAG: DUF973 family protein [Sulfolobales archaeon]
MASSGGSDVSITAFTKMRRGLLYILIGWALLGLSFVVFVSAFIAMGVFQMPHTYFGRPFLPVFGALLSALVVIVIGCILSLIGFYLEFIPGTTELVRVSSEFSTPSRMVRLGYVWGLISVLVGAAFLPFLPAVGFIILALGIVLLVVGHIGMVVLCLKLNNFERDSLYLISGILFIVGIFIPILIVVGLILMYLALSDSIRRHALTQRT